MSNHGYHTRNNTPPTEQQTPLQSNVSTDKSSTNKSSQIGRLEAKLLSHFDNLSTEFLNLKVIIIKILQIENEHLRNQVSYLNKKVVSLEANHNILEQYGRRNNIEIIGIPDTVQDNQLENKLKFSMPLVLMQNQSILKIVIELGSPKITLKKS